MRTINNLGYLLNHVAFVMSRQSDQVLQERLGLGFSQFKIMMVLSHKPHIQQKEIAEKLGQTEASISRQIKLLTDQGLLQAVQRPENRRQRITTLTLKGERYTDEAIAILNKYHAPVYDSLSEKQAAMLQDALAAMHQQTCGNNRPGSCHSMVDES